MNTKMMIISVSLFAAIGIGGFMVGQKYKLVPQESGSPSLVTPTQPIVGGDRDIHGCIGSAGYSWCEPKQKCLRIWEEPCEATASPTPSGQVPSASSGQVPSASSGQVPSASPADESETIKAVIKQALVAKRGSSANELSVSVSKNDGAFATGGASGQGGGGMWLATKINGTWKLVWDGNGTIGCEDIAPYNFPSFMVPECWNTATQKSITR